MLELAAVVRVPPDAATAERSDVLVDRVGVSSDLEERTSAVAVGQDTGMTVVVEPVVTREKLLALLAEEHEQSVLDYKTTLNLGKGHTQDLVELAKDVAALRAEEAGGYIVVGADNYGKPMPGLTPDLTRHFDEAVLRPKLDKYLDSAGLRSAVHEVAGHQVALIYVPTAETGWCVFRAPGEYEVDSKKHYVFRVGDVFVRHGTSSERWTDADVDRLIKQVVDRRKDDWRRELSAEFTEHARLNKAVRDLRDQSTTAITWRMDAETFDELVIELLRQQDDIPLRHLLDQAGRDSAPLIAGDDLDEFGQLLNRVTTIAATALHHQRATWFTQAIATLQLIYESGLDEHGNTRGTTSARLWYAVIIRVYALGALAVREKNWAAVRALAEPRPTGQAFRVYGSWLRHALTMAARAGMFESEEKAGLLASAHNVIRDNAALRPDRSADDSQILDSLIQFDVYGALVVIGLRGSADDSNFYTNFARYYSQRSAPAFVAMVTDPSVRAALFDGDDRLLADAVLALVNQAQREIFQYHGWMGLDEPAVTDFVNRHRADTT